MQPFSHAENTPPADVRGRKQAHSPWSAPRNRKRQATVRAEPAPLAIISEDYSSPPKRRNGGTSPAARELQLSQAGLVLEETLLKDAGPLAQGLLQAAAAGEDGYSPLATGLVRSSLSASAGVSSSAFAAASPFVQPEQQDSAGSPPKQVAVAAAAAAAVGAGSGSGSGSLLPQHTAATVGVGPRGLGAAGSILELASCSYGVLDRAWTAPAGMHADAHAHHEHHPPRPLSQLTDASRRSHGGDLDTDMRSSWGSERSADVQSWREMQARLHEEYVAAAAAQPGRHQRRSSSGAGGGLRDPAGQHEAMVASVDLLRDSLELPSCTERQISTLPLRTSMTGGRWQQSHTYTSPVGEPKAQHKLPSSMQSPAPARGPGSSQKPKIGTCFMCPSPFCKPSRQVDDEAEVVRRTESEGEFVLHRTQSFNSAPRERSIGKPRRTSLNQPPSPSEQELVHRQGGFSAKCSTPVHLLSPHSAYSDEDSGYSPTLGLESEAPAPTSQELLASLQDQSKNPTIDELNDMLRSFCTLDVHPKDAEELVHEACNTCQLAPNATTLRTLDKIWAAHEQMYG